MRPSYLIATALIAVLTVGNAPADPMTFRWTGWVCGTFDDQPLPPTFYVVNAQSSIGQIETGPFGFPVIWFSTPATIMLTGIGTFEFDFSAFMWWDRVNFDDGVVGITNPGGLVLHGPISPVLRNWDMQSPVFASAWGPGWFSGGFYDTTGGVLNPDPCVGTMTFRVTVVPEPATATTFVLVTLAAAGALRRRR